ncbi:MAG: hypothetical protein IPQ01_07995 [Zoogloea sp.]|jgi:hypothetical protein|nr:hypothetical protein [Zoogloea sp.]
MLIYADFNGLEDSLVDADMAVLDLTGYGTLASLSRHGVQLRVGQRLAFSDFDGLEVVGEIGFDSARVSERSSGWYARFSRGEIKDVSPREHDFATHLCFKCRNDLKPYLDKVGRSFVETCPHCGTPVMAPLLPPN